jgi:hypothetical protein
MSTVAENVSVTLERSSNCRTRCKAVTDTAARLLQASKELRRKSSALTIYNRKCSEHSSHANAGDPQPFFVEALRLTEIPVI